LVLPVKAMTDLGLMQHSRLKTWIDSGCVQDWSTPYTVAD